MKLFKRITSVLLSVVMVLLMVSTFATTALAVSNPYPTEQWVGGVQTIPCTWYAWQQAYDRFGIEMPNWGNACYWYWAAKNTGAYPTGTEPRANSIAVWEIPSHEYGHVAFVTAVNGSEMTINEGGRKDATNSGGIVNGQVVPSTAGSAWSYDGRILTGFIYLEDYSAEKVTKESYLSHCTIEVTEADVSLRNMPCSTKTDANSQVVESGAQKGDRYEAIGLVKNTADNLWYKVITKSGQIGYIYAGNVKFVAQLTSDVTVSGVVAPTVHMQGNDFGIGGTISAKYQLLNKVAAWANNSSGGFQIGISEDVSTNTYNLSGSKIDNGLEFNNLAIGNNTYYIGANVKTYYAADAKNVGTKTTTVDLYQSAFSVVKNTGSYANISAGDYYLRNNSTGKYLAVDGGIDVAHQNVSVASFNGGNEMRIAISAASSGYVLRPIFTNRIINPNGDYVSSGLNVDIVNNLSDSSQWWLFEKVDGGYVIRNAQNQDCVLDVSGTNVIVSTYTGAASQIWTVNPWITYTLSYNANGGSGAPANQAKAHGIDLTLPGTVPTRAGYTFLGWSTSSTATTAQYQPGGIYTGNGDVTLYAVWSADRYTVSYNANGGSGAPAAQTKTYGQNLTLSSAVPARDGYEFLGWAYNSLAITAMYQPGDTYSLNSDVTLYAVWSADCYTVSYNANGGSGAPTAQTKTYGQVLTLSGTVPTRSGYTFLGWATDSAATAAGYQPGGTYAADGNVTLYAVWQKSIFSVTYDANGGTGAPEAQEKTAGQQLTLATGVPTRTGYIFLGWATDSTATTAQYQPGDLYTEDAAITLYALWEEDHWSFDPETGTLTVFMEGPMDDYDTIFNGTAWITSAPWGIYADQIQTVYVADSVTEIGECAFYGLNNLTSVRLHDNITRIGSLAFVDCTSLVTIDLPESLTVLGGAFSGCESLESIVIPSGITTIGGFAYCKALKKVVLPDSVTTISYMAFYGCSSLEEITWPASLKTIGMEAFRMCGKLAAVELPDGLEEIGHLAFSSCGFTEIFIPASVKTIYREFDPVKLEMIYVDENNPVYWADERGVLFEGTKLHTAPFKLSGNYQIPDGTTKICHSAFKNNPNLVSIIMPASVTEIENCAFENCNSLTTVYYAGTPEQYAAITNGSSNASFVNADVEYITIEGTCGENLTWKLNGGVLTVSGTGPMDNYSGGGAPWIGISDLFEAVEISDGVTTIGRNAFFGCYSLQSVTIGNSVTNIGESAFYECKALRNITIPDSVKTIGSSAFENCTALSSVDFGDGVTTIGSYAFYVCSLWEIVLPEGLVEIGAQAFDCGWLRSVTLPSTLESIGLGAFWSCAKLQDVYYAGTSAQWENIQIGADNEHLLNAMLHTEDPTLTSITVKTQPTKTVYEIGESLNTAGLTLTATYSDGSTETITDGFAVTGFDSTTTGAKTVTVTYGDKTATFTVTVNEAVVDENAPKIIVNQVTGIVGNTVSVTIALENNPGIAGMNLVVNFDSNVLQLQAVEDAGVLGTNMHKPQLSNPYTLSWANDTATENFVANGTIVTLKFLIMQDAPNGEYPITVTYNYDNYDILDKDFNKVKFETVNGSITVTDVLIGDVNGDGSVNNIDRMMLARYLANWDGYGAEDLMLVAADVNGDGSVNNIDRMVLARHLANWEGYEELPYTA